MTTCKSPHGRTSTKMKAKKKAEERTVEATLDYVLQHAVDENTPQHIQRSLLSALSGTVTQVQYQEMSIACNVPLIDTMEY